MMSTGAHKWILIRFLSLTTLLVPFAPLSIAIPDDTEEELIKQAEDLFKDELYINAFPLFSQLLSLYPDNINYNYKFSVCMLYADEEKAKAISYLEKVTSNLNADKKANFYLGYAYHLNYQFRKAITAYNKYKASGSKKDIQQLQVARRIEMCENGLTLLRNKAELAVLSKTDIKETEYFRTYDMALLTGKILVKPNDFKTAHDIDKREESLVYLGKNAKMLFYSSYGTSGDNRDLYMVLKKSDGAWGTAERLPDYINSAYDENFPIMHPNRNVLYFSSKGHNSMGGYDIFKARYDSSTNRWSKPVNLDFAINSADDDILYLPTADERTAFFSSKRSSVQGQISVYKIRLKEAPGRFTAEGEPEIAVVTDTDPQLEMEEILEEAHLEVNAKEEDFIESTSTTTSSESTPSESMQAATFTNLTNEQLVGVGFEYAAKIKEDEVRIQKEADIAFDVAREKKNQSTAKANEAEAIRSRLENISDAKQKEIATEKAANLEKESIKLDSEADLAFDFAKTLTSDAETRKQQAAEASANAEKVKAAVANDQEDESIPLLIELKVMVQSIDNNPSGVAQKYQEKELAAKTKETESAEANEKIQYMEEELIEMDADIKVLFEQAEQTKDPVIKEEIYAQAQELEAEKKDTESELDITYVNAQELDLEAKALRSEADLLEGVSSEILTSSGSSTVSSASTASTKSSTEETSSEEPLISIVSNTTDTKETSDESSAEPPTSSESETSTKSVAASEETPEESYDITPESVEDAILTEENIAEEIIAVEKLEKEADNYDIQARIIREKAETVDPAFRENALREAAKYEAAAANKRTKASESTLLINTLIFKTNVSTYDNLTTNNRYLTAEDLAEVSDKQAEANRKFEQAQVVRNYAETIEDPNEKSAALKEADQLEGESIAAQEQINNSLNYKENKGEIAEKNKSLGTMESEEVLEISRIYEESDNLYTQARGLRANAQAMDDPKKKADAFKDADALERQAIEKQQAAIHLHELYQYEGVIFEAVQTARPMSTEEKESLNTLEGEYTTLAAEAKTVRANAETLDDPQAVAAGLERANELETQAISKQREALNIYFESDAEVAALLGEEPPSETARTSSSTGDQSSSEPLVSIESPDTDPSSETAPAAADIEPATETTPPASTVSTGPDNRTADELAASSEAKREEAKRLYESIERIQDPDEMMAALEKAEKLETSADAEMARANQMEPASEVVSVEPPTTSAQTPSSSESREETSSTPPTTGASSESSEATSTTEGDAALADASPEEILDAIMNEEENFYIDDSGNSDIEYVEANSETINRSFNETPATSGASSGDKTPSSSETVSPQPTVAAVSALTVDKPLEEDIFAVEEIVSYTPANPIPVNPVIPSGLLFKVQIGAFRNPIPQNLFKGINPIMGEKTGMGFIRYSAGLFRKLPSANEAKGLIRRMGYPDAFVVAFYDGARVSIADARKMLEDGTIPQPIASKTSSGTPATSSTGATSGSVPGTTDIATITELFYTVQVGVYSKPFNVGEKFNLNELYSVKTSNGYIRYSHGRFNSFSDASNRKEIVVGKGILDAFVTAYYNGKRISVTQARSMPAPAPAPTRMTTTPDVTPGLSIEEEEMLEKEKEPAPPPPVEEPAVEAKYMVKIGEFGLDEDVAIDEATTFISIKDLGIEVHNIAERAIYTVGEFIRYKEAEELRRTVQSRGIEDASIVVFIDGDIISVEEYLRSTIDAEPE